MFCADELQNMFILNCLGNIIKPSLNQNSYGMSKCCHEKEDVLHVFNTGYFTVLVMCLNIDITIIRNNTNLTNA